MDFETETPAGYITIEQAAKQDADPELITLGTFWELHPDVSVNCHIRDESGYIIGDVELTDRAAIRDVEEIDRGMSYVLAASQDGDFFRVEALLDPWTPVRLVDER